ncbi:hypothetical protein [Mycobacterium shimoidei]|uniref:Secreted protein n=1 Tax=Mycobacterium shimoidei TaxID=29313 RepID=A0A1E3TEK3_MYCSH|nr:hypothetical protein [Mycobacterium shimoidei]MCV7260247.1 hypothetical protein [Mycobacterium shimoidei]ODR12864.1 hypothetical protein BHQ16_13320 [Mycobacterium shimoidei]ORW80750.1 hypothetical protein AWC26_10610 [Mycobacterium shimoidei]SRX96308.1 hypothetical protein MSP7336_04585 [Mycobacterium shimoidei]
MNIIRNINKRVLAVGAAAAVAVPAMLLGGWRTAQATNPVYFTNTDGSMQVIYGGGGLALSVTVVDTTNPPGATQLCHYHSVGVMNTLPFPYDADVWVTGPTPSNPVTILLPSPGAKYSVNVTCLGTGNSAAYSPVIF